MSDKNQSDNEQEEEAPKTETPRPKGPPQGKTFERRAAKEKRG